MLRKFSKVLTAYFRSSLQTLEHPILTQKETPNLFRGSGKRQGNKKASFGRFRKGKELTQGHLVHQRGGAGLLWLCFRHLPMMTWVLSAGEPFVLAASPLLLFIHVVVIVARRRIWC